MRQRLVFAIATFGCVAFSGLGQAAASARAPSQVSATNEVGLAGYHFTVSKGASSLKVMGSITVPTSHCSSKARRYQLQIGASYSRRGYRDNATVLLMFVCQNDVQAPGSAELVAGFNALYPTETIKPGQTLTIRDYVTASSAKAVLTFPGGKTVSVTAGGGAPIGGAYALTTSRTTPPHYGPVAFSGCMVNGKPLADAHPSIWRSVTTSGTVDGKVSALANGQDFTITY